MNKPESNTVARESKLTCVDSFGKFVKGMKYEIIDCRWRKHGHKKEDKYWIVKCISHDGYKAFRVMWTTMEQLCKNGTLEYRNQNE